MYVRGLLTAELKREIHRQTVEESEEGPRVMGAISEELNTESKEELNLEDELC